MARLYCLVRLTSGEGGGFDLLEIERKLASASRSWGERLREQITLLPNDSLDIMAPINDRKGNINNDLMDGGGERVMECLSRLMGADGIPAAYREGIEPRKAVEDLLLLTALENEGGESSDPSPVLGFSPQGEEGVHNLKFCHRRGKIPLSRLLPILASLGLEATSERSFGWKIKNKNGGGTESYWLHEIWFDSPWKISGLVGRGQTAKMRAAFEATWRGICECDSFNKLIPSAGLEWKEAALWRALCRYLHQTGFSHSLESMAASLAQNPQVTQKLTRLFSVKFDPSLKLDWETRKSQINGIEQEIEEALNSVSSLEQDQILRRLQSLIGALLRTSFHLESPYSSFSFKFDCGKIPDLPQPRPLYEIWVYSARMEGIHLRFGKVARGGIRWSERPEDFRTEILGLVKAQKVKNSVIVPTGSKGGFVVRGQASTPAELKSQIVVGYKTLIFGMLQVTDNYHTSREGENIVAHPPNLVVWDGPDPYLVVAADKGTATFSDMANGLSKEFGFWLDDAFASGGSAGYDHKKMGITARGAFISVERHARNLGFDPHENPFTVVGVGDMGGDVFGNGMLRSKAIRLVAAFDHRHIFLDPDPDPLFSYNERERLFRLPSSSWADYNPKFISQGGGVFPRNLKSIPLSPQIKKRLEMDEGELSPQELIKCILRAPVELLWFGGIGTYVKSSAESHLEAGDRANDPLRLNGSEIRAKMVAEGANLGVTQKGRIEYGLKGGIINTDAIDNSAGVDCSDHEVNIKIILAQEITAGNLRPEERDPLLSSMTDEVGTLVLRDNYLQNFILSVCELKGAEIFDSLHRLILILEESGELDRNIESLPSEQALLTRQKEGQFFTRSELSVLLAYAKISLNREILESDLPTEEVLRDGFLNSFPKPLQERLGNRLFDHRLAREIVATILTNEVVNFGGPTFVSDMALSSDPLVQGKRDARLVCRGYLIFKTLFNLQLIGKEIEVYDQSPLSPEIKSHEPLEYMARLAELTQKAILWWSGRPEINHPIGEQVGKLKPLVGLMEKSFEQRLKPNYNDSLKGKIEFRLAVLESMVENLTALDILATIL